MSPRKPGTWSYRIVRMYDRIAKDYVFAIHECQCIGGRVTSISEGPAVVLHLNDEGDAKDGLALGHARMLAALGHPIVDYDTMQELP